jgi:glycosyltransferase involved in cell wall biosynthesis
VLDQQPSAATGLVAEENSGLMASSRGRPQRILHVVPSLERGGIELWLMQVLQTINRDRYEMDFLVLNASSGPLESELRSLGSQVVTSRQPRKPWRLWSDFANMSRIHGPYDVVHSHVHHLSGLIMRMAARHRVPIRIVHSHNDTRPAEADASWRRQLYLRTMKRWIRRDATHRVAASRIAAEDLFGHGWIADPRCQILLYGLDFSPFASQGRRAETRQALGLPENALVIGHVGWFQRRKNHAFVLDIAAELFAREKRAWLLLVGEGELMPTIKSRAQQLRIADRVVFTGTRSDIPLLMRAMDAFLFPSHHEGLGLVLLEAQADGLPCVLSEDLPHEADVVPSLMHRLPLTAPAAHWAECLLQVAGKAPISRESALQALSESEFSIHRSVARLLQVYDTHPRG